jgi:hypothetical protein
VSETDHGWSDEAELIGGFTSLKKLGRAICLGFRTICKGNRLLAWRKSVSEYFKRSDGYSGLTAMFESAARGHEISRPASKNNRKDDHVHPTVHDPSTP